MRTRRDPGRQGRYEAFLESVSKREEAAIRSSLPDCLARMAELVNEAKTTIDTVPADDPHYERVRGNWNDKSLPRLRDLYRAVRDGEPRDGLKALEEMATQLNSWFRRLSWRVEIRRTMVNDSRTFDRKASRIDRLEVVKENR